MENYKTWNSDFCNKVIHIFCNDDVMEKMYIDDRKYKKHILHDFEKDGEYSWIWVAVDDLIKNTLGVNFYLKNWVIGLRYDIGDYFLEHKDDYGTKNDRVLSGGVELSDKSTYDGGVYLLEGVDMRAERGVLFTHNPHTRHEITKVTKGSRYSLHFCIGKEELI